MMVHVVPPQQQGQCLQARSLWSSVVVVVEVVMEVMVEVVVEVMVEVQGERRQETLWSS